MRGHLYENLVVADVMKGAFNKGIRPELYHFRDSRGRKADLLIRGPGGGLIPVEIKSADAFHPDFVKGLERLGTLGIRGLEPGVVLYDGGADLVVRGVRALNPLRSDDLWSALTRPPGEEAA